MLKEEINTGIDLISRELGWGGRSTVVGENIYGINHRSTGNMVPNNLDGHGLTFFTRPCMNLSYDNIAANRVLTTLGVDAPLSYQRAIRCYLDPWGYYRTPSVGTPLVDPKQAFMPLLTNNLISINGWPDLSSETYTSNPDKMNGSFSFVDSVVKINGTYDLTANFKNIQGDPITLLFTSWLHYMSEVYIGNMFPYPNFVLENRIDYQTRIYRVILDPSKRFVQKIGATGASFPTSSPLGAAFNYSADQVMQQDNDQLSIRFRCMGAIYLDPILIDEFNATVCLFNEGMTDSKRELLYRKLTVDQLNSGNYLGYPRIAPQTYELEWWIPLTTYSKFATAGVF